MLQAVLGGLVGALLVFALTQLVLVIRERRDFIAAVIVVLDEMQANLLECQTGKSPNQVEHAALELTVADVMRSDRFDSVQLVLARRLPNRLRKKVSGAYRDAKSPAAHINLKESESKTIFSSLEEKIGAAASELDSYRSNLEKVIAWVQPSKRIPYVTVSSGAERIG